MNVKKQPVKLDLTVEQVSILFKGLGKLPFEEVYELIGIINAQVNAQVKDAGTTGTEKK
jgi:hypothetical protein